MRRLKICLALATKLLCICVAGPLTLIIIVCNWGIQKTNAWFLSADALMIDAYLEGDEHTWGD